MMKFLLLIPFQLAVWGGIIVAIVSGLDWIADAIPLFTEPGSIFGIAVAVAFVSYILLYLIGMALVKNVMNDDTFFDRFDNFFD